MKVYSFVVGQFQRPSVVQSGRWQLIVHPQHRWRVNLLVQGVVLPRTPLWWDEMPDPNSALAVSPVETGSWTILVCQNNKKRRKFKGCFVLGDVQIVVQIAMDYRNPQKVLVDALRRIWNTQETWRGFLSKGIPILRKVYIDKLTGWPLKH